MFSVKEKQKIVIIGGGFAGLKMAQTLNKSNFKVVLIDKQNHHQFQPLFYQVATAGLEPSSIAFPFRKIFQKSKNIEIRYAEVQKINSINNSIETSIGDISYDHLIIATGCTTNFFGNKEITSNALSMKTTQEAIEIRNKILINFEKILSENEPDKEGLFNIIIVGGGPTGVELSGAFAEMKKNILPKDYPSVDFSKLNIILLEGSKNTLNSMHEVSKIASRKYLEKMGVIVRTETYVSSYDGITVTLKNGEQLKSKNVIWAAGVAGNTIEGINNEVINRSRYKVDRFNKIIGYDNIYALGDIAYMETPKYPNGHPQVANVAINQGKNLAKNFIRSLQNKPLNEYEYKDLGSMATIGKNKAVVETPLAKFQGRFAWYIWMFLHLRLILGLCNKRIIIINWEWGYITNDSSLRLILKSKDDLNQKGV